MDSIKVRVGIFPPPLHEEDKNNQQTMDSSDDEGMASLVRMIEGNGRCDVIPLLLKDKKGLPDIFVRRVDGKEMDYMEPTLKASLKPKLGKYMLSGWSYNRLKSKRRVWKKHGKQSMSYGFSIFGGALMLGMASALQATLIGITTAFLDSPEAITSINIDDFVDVFSENPKVSIASSAAVVSTALLLTGWSKTAKFAEPALRFFFMSLLTKSHVERTLASATLEEAKEKLSSAVTDEEVGIAYKNYTSAKHEVGGRIGELCIFATFAGVSAYAETTSSLSPTMGQIMCLPDDTIFLVKAGLEVNK